MPRLAEDGNDSGSRWVDADGALTLADAATTDSQGAVEDLATLVLRKCGRGKSGRRSDISGGGMPAAILRFPD